MKRINNAIIHGIAPENLSHSGGGPMKVKTGITIGMRTGERLAPVVHYGSRGPGLLAFLVVALIAAAVAFASTALP